MTFEFKLPDIGEGLTEGEVVKWHVKVGDSVKENQPLVNVLTDKAEVEIPSPKNGKISELHAKEGQKVRVGEVLVSFEIGPGAIIPGKASTHAPVETNGHAERSAKSAQPADDRVGAVSATPAVRKLASELKVDLSKVRGSGPGGRVTEEDVRNASRSAVETQPKGWAPRPAPAGDEEKVPFVGIRRKTAEKMAMAAKTIPHVTHADECDYTALVELRQELKGEAESRGVKLTFLPFILRALAKTLAEYPNLNATLDEQGGAIIRKRQVNCGIAAATQQGLVVPVVKGAHEKGVWDLAIEINRLAEKARANKLDVSDLQGGTFTVTNIGPIGGTFATPIINHPEVAILGIMKVQERPVARDGKVVIRQMGNLCLSFDHRVLDGAEAAQFTSALIKRLENPRTLL